MMGLETYGLYLSILLFTVGLLIVIIKRNAIFVLIGIELMLNAGNLNLMVFSSRDPAIQGQVFGIFVVALAAAEAAIALAILLHIYKHFKTANLDEITKLKF